MANPNKAKGTAWESAVRDYLNGAHGLVDESGALRDPFNPMNIRRVAQEGSKDIGDIHAVPFILECKDVKNPAVPTWLRQAEKEARHAHFPYGVVVAKVRGKGTAAGRAHFDVRTWTRVRTALGLHPREAADLYGVTVSARGLNTGRWYITVPLARFAVLLADMRGVFREVR
ncbi:hypothetical protein [Streptomyces qinzhouensis]|uniref:Holliday junction resolvase n=1 Tax=Streptomyces qinzhouensis TaxID=2599401 RepID=A0A5B8JE17_9ACTN|nr:hypothetical protein [Streptomyces qinzhouensis]QDY79807.1 hypothetical protein FQU76_28400 [Streptomyces qinzhouensis]